MLDVIVKPRNRISDQIEEDVSCGSTFVISAIYRVGAGIWKSYWIPTWQQYYLVIDNVGGHGTKEVIRIYQRMLIGNYNMEIIFQSLDPLYQYPRPRYLDEFTGDGRTPVLSTILQRKCIGGQCRSGVGIKLPWPLHSKGNFALKSVLCHI